MPFRETAKLVPEARTTLCDKEQSGGGDLLGGPGRRVCLSRVPLIFGQNVACPVNINALSLECQLPLMTPFLATCLSTRLPNHFDRLCFVL